MARQRKLSPERNRFSKNTVTSSMGPITLDIPRDREVRDVYGLTGFVINYFSVMYLLIAYVYIIAAILMIKYDLLKQRLELEKILEVQKKVNKKENIDKYAESTINELIKMRKDLLNTPIGENKTPWHKHYKSALDSGQTKNVAVKSILNKYLQNKTLKGKTIKTIGGFIALGMAIKPIDHFVEEVLIGKVIAPNLAKKKSV